MAAYARPHAGVVIYKKNVDESIDVLIGRESKYLSDFFIHDRTYKSIPYLILRKFEYFSEVDASEASSEIKQNYVSNMALRKIRGQAGLLLNQLDFNKFMMYLVNQLRVIDKIDHIGKLIEIFNTNTDINNVPFSIPIEDVPENFRDYVLEHYPILSADQNELLNALSAAENIIITLPQLLQCAKLINMYDDGKDNDDITKKGNEIIYDEGGIQYSIIHGNDEQPFEVKYAILTSKTKYGIIKGGSAYVETTGNWENTKDTVVREVFEELDGYIIDPRSLLKIGEDRMNDIYAFDATSQIDAIQAYIQHITMYNQSEMFDYDWIPNPFVNIKQKLNEFSLTALRHFNIYFRLHPFQRGSGNKSSKHLKRKSYKKKTRKLCKKIRHI